MNDPDKTRAYQSEDATAVAEVESAQIPLHIGRYRIERVLGEGGFGLVYLAHDDQLKRLVAIKVPHARLVDQTTAAEAYLVEARTVANLDHPNIVPVHDVGSSEQIPCFVVSKYIDGIDLARRLKQSRPTVDEAIKLVATVAEALHHAHKQGLVHRDIKPGNIFLDGSGTPFVADFGLALREQDAGKGPHYAGTPAYMSPEQARGEGHRVDGRSDIFSLGVVFYELLAGRRPFIADSQDELLEQITSFEPRPLRQLDEGIPREVERICFKALSKRASERYMTAGDMAEDLRHCLVEQSLVPQSDVPSKGSGPRLVTATMQPASTSIEATQIGGTTTPTSHGQSLKIVPKGLRSFDAHDADFFLELLPGPRDRDGLPDSIRFWKARIEEADAEKTFSVGLICGPSGCGKSSLVKAGLLPHLSDQVLAVYVEATALDTEARLLNGLWKRCPTLATNLGLKETLAALRRGQGIPVGKKVLVVLDQFEQWLHAKKEEDNSDLLQALRQCDGGRVQCLLMVRDDFWMAIIRFMRELEVRLIEGQNSGAVDLFPVRHAERVLAAFGRAFGVLPEHSSEMSNDQKHFIEQAVSGLAQEGKVIPIRLALFAEMMKGKTWTPAALKEVGGTAGVGSTFLEETFSSATAPPEHRYHQKAARAVLRALLPEAGTDIKGHMRSQQDLLDASGYAGRRKDFEELLQILDSDIRLITPTDPEGADDAAPATQAGMKYYQLTHDYLVHSLRDWLTRKQKETRRGRAGLLLADRASVWNARPENRQLPSIVQWLQIMWLTDRKIWSPPQRKMMARAARYYALRSAIVAIVLALATFAGLAVRTQVGEQRRATQAAGLVQRLLDAETAQVPAIITDMSDYRKWTDPLLRAEHDKAASASRQKLHCSLALLPGDSSLVDDLYTRLLAAQPHEVEVIRDALNPYKEALLDKLWTVVESPQKGKESQRLRAASALAKYDPDSRRWETASSLVVNDLVLENPVFLGQWSDGFRPVRKPFITLLTAIYRDHTSERAAERALATNLLADYVADNQPVLADLLMDADEAQFAVIFPRFKEHAEQGLSLLVDELHTDFASKIANLASLNWKVRFYQWERVGPQKPPADWESVLKSPVLDELPMSRLSFRSGEGPPTKRVAGDHFAAVATTDVILPRGEYAFSVTFDDGVRLWLDNKVIFENWGPNGETTKIVVVECESGKHTIRVEYFQIDFLYALDCRLSLSDATKERLAKRQANAAIALLMMKQPAHAWQLLNHVDDPRVRSYLIHRLAPFGADPGDIVKHLAGEPDLHSRRACLQSLGEFGEEQFPAAQRQSLIDQLLAIYKDDRDAGMHSASEWLLRHWGQEASLKAIEAQLRTKESNIHSAMRANLPKDVQGRLEMLAAEIDRINKALRESEQDLPKRQAKWEEQELERSVPIPTHLDEGLIAHYPLDETAGIAVASAIPGEAPGRFLGRPQRWMPGVVGGALQLHENGVLVGSKPLDLECDHPFSYGCWFQYDAKVPMILLSTRDSSKGYRGFDLSLELDHQLRMELIGEDPDLTDERRVPFSQSLLSVITATSVNPLYHPEWHHVMVTYDGSGQAQGVQIAVDGRQQPTQILFNQLSGTIRTSLPLYVGSRHGTFRFQGLIDDVRVYNRCLTETDVQELYDSGIKALMRRPVQDRSAVQQKTLSEYFRRIDVPSRRIANELVASRQALQSYENDHLRRWYVNGQGHTMIVIPGPVDFLMGSPMTEVWRDAIEVQHQKRIGRTTALASKEVTVEQFLRFRKDHVYNKQYAPAMACPVNVLSWYDAAAYCNWLSEAEGIPMEQWCYLPNAMGAYEQGMKVALNYLERTGYRLPTEAEWEHGCRAGAETAYSFGDTEELLGKYAWYKINSAAKSHPVGSLKPNELGLNDMHGNVWEWTHDAYKSYPKNRSSVVNDDGEEILAGGVSNQNRRVSRGGGFDFDAPQGRSACRYSFPPTDRYINLGFRVARTLPLVPLPEAPATPDGGERERRDQ